MSIEEWLKQQEKRWTCPLCDKKLHWYSEECSNCGTEFMAATEEAIKHTKHDKKEQPA